MTTIGEGRRQFEVVTSMNSSAVHQLPAQLEVHDLHLKNMRGKNSVKDKASLFS